jgi:hypothetical protein
MDQRHDSEILQTAFPFANDDVPGILGGPAVYDFVLPAFRSSHEHSRPLVSDAVRWRGIGG